jgi:hypothetical protein
LFGFVPWEAVFSVEIRNEALQKLANGQLAWGALFLLVCTCFIVLLQRTKGLLQGVFVLVFPVLLLFAAFIWTISVISMLPQWRDQYVYCNGDDYLVVQMTESGVTGDHAEWRLEHTRRPYDMIRRIDELHPVDDNKNVFASGAKEVIYGNKTWHKVR